MATRCRHQNLDHFLAHRHWDRKLAYHQTKGWFSWDQVTWIKTSLLERILCQLNKLHSPDFIHLPTTIRDIADLSGPRDPNHTPSSPFGNPNWTILSDVLIELDICKNLQSGFNSIPNPTFLGSGVLHLHLRMLR